jgi:energy-coupling factor transporter ATP-binding protein EcfA2
MPETTQPRPAIEVRDLRLRYSDVDRVVLKGVNLVLNQGEVKLLLGPSGAGKSSLALTLDGLIPHQMEGEIRGAVLVDGVSTIETTVPWLASRVGMVFQDPDSQLATLTVGDETAFGMENLLVPPGQMPARIASALARVGMESTEPRGTSALSGGQKQHVVLASTLAMGVSILVLDEPTANLDPAGTANFFDLLDTLQAEGNSVLIIEHKLDRLVGQIDSVAVLDWQGRIAADGPPREVFDHEEALLRELGVWVPQVAELTYALRDCDLHLAPFPLTIEEAVGALSDLLDAAPAQVALPAKPNLAETRATPLAVQVDHLTYTYPDGVTALRDVSMHVPKGDFYALVGPNGSGKSTLARHLIGLLRSPGATIRIGGRDIASLPPGEVNKRVGYVFQNPEHQFVALTVYDELAFSLRAKKLPETEVRARIQPLLQEFGLEELSAVNPYKLSQGQKRRLSVATMLALDPDVLILDEPTFGQDHANTISIMQRLQALNRRGITIIIITHDMSLVAEYANSCGVLIGGWMSFEGPVHELFSHPELLREAHLEVPAVYQIGQRLAERFPGLQPPLTVAQMRGEVCRLLGIQQSEATSTASTPA